MKNSKYIKVSVSEKLPEEFGHYVTFTENNEQGYSYSDDSTCEFRSESIITHWLQEVPDYEDEMKEMLEELTTHHFNFMGCDEINELKSRAEELLTKLKTES